MKIERNGVEIELTLQEVQQAYDIYLHDCKVLDAKSQYEDWIEYEGFEKNVEGDMEDFVRMYGFHPDAASDPGSEHYLLEKFVSKFDEKFDCGRAENDIWHEAISDVMAEVAKEAAKTAEEKVYEVVFHETVEYKMKIVARSAEEAKAIWKRTYFDPQVSMTYTQSRIIGASAVSSNEVSAPTHLERFTSAANKKAAEGVQ